MTMIVLAAKKFVKFVIQITMSTINIIAENFQKIVLKLIKQDNAQNVRMGTTLIKKINAKNTLKTVSRLIRTLIANSANQDTILITTTNVKATLPIVSLLIQRDNALNAQMGMF
jgi:hypothetical protein